MLERDILEREKEERERERRERERVRERERERARGGGVRDKKSGVNVISFPWKRQTTTLQLTGSLTTSSDDARTMTEEGRAERGRAAGRTEERETEKG